MTTRSCTGRLRVGQKPDPPDPWTALLLADLIAAIYLAAFPVAFKVSVVTTLLFLCLFGLGLDWLPVGGGGALVVTSSLELGCALCTVG